MLKTLLESKINALDLLQRTIVKIYRYRIFQNSIEKLTNSAQVIKNIQLKT